MNKIMMITAAATLVATMQGCEQMQRALGYPTDTEVSNAQQRLAEAEDDKREAERNMDLMQQQIDAVEDEAAAAEVRKTELRRLYAETAQRLTTLEGAAADALSRTLDDINTELQAASESGRNAEAIVAKHKQRFAQLQGDRLDAELRVTQLNQLLDDYAVAGDEAIGRVVGLVTEVGAAADELGVPKAQETTNTIGNMLKLGLGTLLGGGFVYQRRRRQAEERRADNLTEVVRANERYGVFNPDVVKTPEDLKLIKTQLKKTLPAEAYEELQRATATAKREAA